MTYILLAVGLVLLAFGGVKHGIDTRRYAFYNCDMKKFIPAILILCALAACGVKSDLRRPDTYPRNYPVH